MTEADRASGRRRTVVLALAALAWALLCLRWFDAAAPLRPRALEAVPVWLLASAFAAAVIFARARRGDRDGSATPPSALDRDVRLVTLLAVLFRLPMALQGGAAYVTADGALSGIMALDVRDGRAHDVFVPNVPYSGSLKAILTAPLAAAIDPARAFALVSVLFYAAFVAALCRLAAATASDGGPAAFRVRAAGLYAAFSPVFVTRYSLSNDGNYVEVLALGAWALVLALRWSEDRGSRFRRAFAIGLLLGVAFWCHILAVIPAAAVGLFLLLESPRDAVRAVLPAAAGFALGDLPGLLWNATHGWESFAYLMPGTATGSGAPRGARGVLGHLLVLLGFDFGYARAVSLALGLVAAAALLALAAGVVRAARRARGAAGGPWRLLLVFTAANLAIALFALPYIPGNPRYLLFLMASAPVLLALALESRAGRIAFVLIVSAGALTSTAQATATIAADREWRAFVAALESEGVRACYTDFFLATRINFLSGGRVTCSAKLGPTTTEYFFRFREEVDAAPAAALVAVNHAAAEKLERRLGRLGVTYERRDLLKPVLLRLSRKVPPEELFPDRDFPMR